MNHQFARHNRKCRLLDKNLSIFLHHGSNASHQHSLNLDLNPTSGDDSKSSSLSDEDYDLSTPRRKKQMQKQERPRSLHQFEVLDFDKVRVRP